MPRTIADLTDTDQIAAAHAAGLAISVGALEKFAPHFNGAKRAEGGYSWHEALFCHLDQEEPRWTATY